MNESKIKCPNCGAMIELTDALKNSIQEELRAEYNRKWVEERKKLDQQREEDTKNLEARLADQKKQLESQVRKSFEDQFSFRLKDMQNQLEEKSRKLKESEDKELDLLQRQRNMEEKERKLKLELERQLTAERAKIHSETAVKITEEFRLKDAEKEKTIHDLLKQIEELRRKAEQGSQQLQGEVLELELEEQLKKLFPGDEIVPVKKGVKGADILQKIFNDFRQPCGMILWEAKRAKDWSKEWVAKLKEDKLEAKADTGVIVTTALPKAQGRIGSIDNIWYCDPISAEGLAMALRAGLIEVALTRSAKENMNDKMEIMYHYLSSAEFRQKIEAIAESFRQMKIDLDSEKTAMNKIWAKREKQMERVIMNTTHLYGSLQGIIGQSLKPIAQLELPAGDEAIETKPE